MCSFFSQKRKEGELLYADLGDFKPAHQDGGMTSVQISPPTTLGPLKKPPQYENTEYADISQFLKKKEQNPAIQVEEKKPEETQEQIPTATAATTPAAQQEAENQEQKGGDAKL